MKQKLPKTRNPIVMSPIMKKSSVHGKPKKVLRAQDKLKLKREITQYDSADSY